MENKNNGLIFFKLASPYQDDITKNCGLFGTEVDENFLHLKNVDIKSVELSGESNSVLVLHRNDGEILPLDVSAIQSLIDVDYDAEKGEIKLSTRVNNEEKEILIDGLLTTTNVDANKLFMRKVYHDPSLIGTGLANNPLKISYAYQTGMYKPVISVINTVNNETLPTDKVINDSYITIERKNPFGCLYTGVQVQKIKEDLEKEKSEWRIPTKEDWDMLLNLVECEDCKLHDTLEVDDDKPIGEYAGKILKGEDYWDYGGKPGLIPNDMYNFRVLPSGYADFEKIISHEDEWAEYWTDTKFCCDNETPKNNTYYTKRFTYNSNGVYQSCRIDDNYCALRLVKDFTGDNCLDVEYINGYYFKTGIVPPFESKEGKQLVWTLENVNFGLNYNPLISPLVEYNEEIEYYYNIWNGKSWDRKLIQENEMFLLVNGLLPEDNFSLYILKNNEIKVLYKDELREVNAELDSLSATTQILIDNETSRATAREEELDDKIDSLSATTKALIEEEENRAVAEEERIEGRLDSEISRAENEEARIEGRLDDEIERAMASESDLNTKIDTETSRATAREEELDDKIDSLSATTKTLIENEENRATGEEARIEGRLDDEIERATSEEKRIEDKLDAEIERAIAKEIEIDNQLISSADISFTGGTITLNTKGENNENITITWTSNYGTF